MTENVSTPYIMINEPIQAIELAEEIRFDAHSHQLSNLRIIENPQVVINSMEKSPDDVPILGQEQPCIVQIVYPQDLSLSTVMKRGRPKKKKQAVEEPLVKHEPAARTQQARTRSGRLVKLPKHMENDFKKIETANDEQEVTVSDFHRFEENSPKNTKMEFAQLQKRKRVVSSQYKCPKCFKAYLGKNKMIEHLKKYPDHGPLPEGFQEFNFDVWNYLFDITQKCNPGQRGVKFCEELSNLLHNVQLLKSALFKTVTDNKNCVHIDKVLGNAIGLAPGKYKFDENELYKDVTVLKLITNSDFFKPNVVNKQQTKNGDDVMEYGENKKLKADSQQVESFSTPTKNGLECNKQSEVYEFAPKTASGDQNLSQKAQETSVKKSEVDQITLPTDLLTEDNLLLHSLPNSRNGVEELMLTGVDNGSNLLDNSTSSDEVMNVDQFVNERFKKIIEPDIEIGNAALNLDLPSLELFQFNTS